MNCRRKVPPRPSHTFLGFWLFLVSSWEASLPCPSQSCLTCRWSGVCFPGCFGPFSSVPRWYMTPEGSFSLSIFSFRSLRKAFLQKACWPKQEQTSLTPPSKITPSLQSSRDSPGIQASTRYQQHDHDHDHDHEHALSKPRAGHLTNASYQNHK